MKVFTVTLLYTGMRISEALAPHNWWCGYGHRLIHIRNGKGGKARSIPINRKPKDKREDYVQWRTPSKQFFATKKTGTPSSGTVQAVIRETRERLGCKKKITPPTFFGIPLQANLSRRTRTLSAFRSYLATPTSRRLPFTLTYPKISW